MRNVTSVLLLAVLGCGISLAGCGGGGASSDAAAPADNTSGGMTLAISPAAPPLTYSGPVNVNFVSFANEPVTDIYMGPLTLNGGGGPLLAGGGTGLGTLGLGTLPQTGMYTLRVDFSGRSSFSSAVYVGWSDVTLYLFP